MVLGQHEAAQFRPEMADDAGRQRRRHHVAVRGLPALAAEIHDMRADHQILHHEIRVAFEAGAARRCGDFDGPFLVDRKLRPLAALFRGSLTVGRRRLRLGRLLHAARLDVRPTRTALEPGNLVAQRRNHSLQLDHLFPLLHNQALQLGVRQTVKIPGRRHSQNEFDLRPPENCKIIPPLVLPLLRLCAVITAWLRLTSSYWALASRRGPLLLVRIGQPL